MPDFESSGGRVLLCATHIIIRYYCCGSTFCFDYRHSGLSCKELIKFKYDITWHVKHYWSSPVYSTPPEHRQFVTIVKGTENSFAKRFWWIYRSLKLRNWITNQSRQCCRGELNHSSLPCHEILQRTVIVKMVSSKSHSTPWEVEEGITEASHLARLVTRRCLKIKSDVGWAYSVCLSLCICEDVFKLILIRVCMWITRPTTFCLSPAYNQTECHRGFP